MRKIRECLQARDIEMVQLGAHILQLSSIPRESWEIILVDCLQSKFSFRIKNNQIEIYPNLLDSGVWVQLNHTGYKAKYAIDSISLDTMTKAIKSFYEGKSNTDAQVNRLRDGEVGSSTSN